MQELVNVIKKSPLPDWRKYEYIKKIAPLLSKNQAFYLEEILKNYSKSIQKIEKSIQKKYRLT